MVTPFKWSWVKWNTMLWKKMQGRFFRRAAAWGGSPLSGRLIFS
jgi:hypothetical protein